MPGRVAHGTYVHDLGRQHPFEVAMLTAAAVVGISRAFQTTSGSIESALPTWLVYVWYALLAIGSITALSGIFWKATVVGLRVEQAGLFVMAAACLVYALVLFVVGGVQAIAAGGLVLGFCGASVVRAVDIGRILVRIHTAVEIAEGTD